jgi:hypothetical protein
MVDIFVDNIIQLGNTPIELKWKELTLKIMKKTSLSYIYELLEDCCYSISKNQNSNKIFVYNGKNNIIALADSFGLKPLGAKIRICPFHNDTNPSLSLSEEKNLFKCFGCSAKGNIIKFNAMLKRLNKEAENGNK